MNWFLDILKSSIGKKLMMAVTGLGFCGFLTAHLAGNLFIYIGQDAFNLYAERLHSLGFIITVMELGLLLFAVVHVLTGLTLFYQNVMARPVRYAVNKSAGGRSIGSRTMPYTGILLLVFVVLHLLDFHFVDKNQTTIYHLVDSALSVPWYALFYVFAVIIAAIHVSHGLWSAFQTLGANHPKYMPLIKAAGLIFSISIGMGFGFIPVYILFFT